MTLGLFLPALLAATALIEVPLFMGWRRKGMVSERAANLMLLATVALPFVAYLVFNLVMPDIGAIEVF